ncbi:MAG TPA: DEAD/DEAH box helicase [Ilumatobacter sp.]|nr:DEAD/DEAH box helicase [Ilumatobacter sp.]
MTDDGTPHDDVPQDVPHDDSLDPAAQSVQSSDIISDDAPDYSDAEVIDGDENDDDENDDNGHDEYENLAVSVEEDDEPVGFAALGLGDELLKALEGLGYEEPTPIQREAIPVLLQGRDLLGQAATGTGKTAAFALPILDGIGKHAPAVPTALVLVPTRELAVQVSEAMFKYGQGLGIKVLPVFGGQPIFRQFKELERGVHVIVATPGRAHDHIKRGSLDLDQINTVVLDEADEMLDMGFSEDIEAILEATPETRQTVLFSATMPKRITGIARKYQNNPLRIEIGSGQTESGKGLIRQTVYFVQRAHKSSALGRVLDIESPTSTIVFCRTRHEVDELTVTMNGRGYRAEALHGGMDQTQRDRVMARLRDGTAELLIATDVAARGLDVDTLSHVVNFDVPAAAESYVHRIGRVGRAGREGVAITLAEPRERRQIGNIERLMGASIAVGKVPTVADLRTKQIELTTEALAEAMASDDLDDYYDVFNAFAGDDPRIIALAAIKLVHEARGATLDEPDIPDMGDRNNDRGNDRKFDKGGKGKFDKGKFDRGGDRGERQHRSAGETGHVYINVGRKAGVRPGDLVGAIANETGLSGSDIGPIRIADFYSVVGVPESSVDDVVRKMRKAQVRGKDAEARRFVESGDQRPPRRDSESGGYQGGQRRDGGKPGHRGSRPRD